MPAPIVSATLQAATLSSISNILAQLLDGYRKGQQGTFSPSDFLRFLLVTFLTAPPNFMWQNLLERTFPGRLPTSDHDILMAERGGHGGPSASTSFGAGSGLLDPVDDDDTRDADYEEGKGAFLRGAHMRGHATGTKLNWQNTMTKWFIDCITLGAIFNTLAFLILMGLLKAKSLSSISDTVRSETIPIIVAGYKIWPIASIISFSLIPVEKRIVFLSGVGLLWGIYLSLVAAKV